VVVVEVQVVVVEAVVVLEVIVPTHVFLWPTV
jgi:hypothetical protein